MKFKKLSMIAAVSAALGMGAVTEAQASSAAGQAEMSISNFIITGGAATPLDFGNFSQLNFLDTLSNSAQLPPGLAFNGTTSSVFAPVVDALAACVPAGCAQNVYIPQPVVPILTSNSHSDSILIGAPITGTGVTVGVTANTIAETLTSGQFTGGANADITLTSSFILNTTTVVGMIFDASTFIRSWTNPGSGSPTAAGSDFKWEITISQNVLGLNTVLADWIPNGNIADGTQTGFSVTSEGCNLSLNSSAGPNQPFPATTCAGHFEAHTLAALVAGTQYSLTIAQHVSSQAVSVPEPSTIALLGLGLFGIGGLARKRKKS